MSSPAPKPAIAFFGATGGCVAATLTHALNAGYPCTALARNPSKLTSLLLSKGVSEQTQAAHLRIVAGDVKKDAAAVRATLQDVSGAPAPLIISGIGMVVGLGGPSDATICQDAVQAIFDALRELKPPVAPFLVAISSTGMGQAEPRDVPILLLPLYRLLLGTPHKDKRVMEARVVEAGREDVIGGFTLVRPSLLTNGKSAGLGKVRAGKVASPAVGYTVRREDVGLWIFEELVVGNREAWRNEKLSLTY